jgi:hypothetical protein
MGICSYKNNIIIPKNNELNQSPPDIIIPKNKELNQSPPDNINKHYDEYYYNKYMKT